MKIESIWCPKIQINDSFDKFLNAIPLLAEKQVVVITSKIVSLCEGRAVPDHSVDKMTLVRQEAEAWLEGKYQSRYDYCLTIKEGILIPSAGIDASNAHGHLVLYPEDCFGSVRKIWEFLRARDGIKQLGVIMTDSHTTPLRWGVTGIGLAWCGIDPLRNYVGQPDLDNRPLKSTKSNVLDGLAAAAVMLMGEGNEQTPMAMVSELGKYVAFQERPPLEAEIQAFRISIDDDLYAPLLKSVDWRFKTKIS